MMNEVMYSITRFDDPTERSYVQYNLFNDELRIIKQQ